MAQSSSSLALGESLFAEGGNRANRKNETEIRKKQCGVGGDRDCVRPQELQIQMCTQSPCPDAGLPRVSYILSRLCLLMMLHTGPTPLLVPLADWRTHILSHEKSKSSSTFLFKHLDFLAQGPLKSWGQPLSLPSWATIFPPVSLAASEEKGGSPT